MNLNYKIEIKNREMLIYKFNGKDFIYTTYAGKFKNYEEERKTIIEFLNGNFSKAKLENAENVYLIIDTSLFIEKGGIK